MATRVHIGSNELRGELAAYAKRFELLEVRGMVAANLRLAPSASTMRRWRRSVTPQFEFAVTAGPTVGKLKPNEAFEAELASMLATATALEARVLVVPTPPEVTPGKLWRDRFATLLDRLHQAMILFGAQRGELLKRFLVEDGVGKDARFWKLAQSLAALYPTGTDERRWVEGVLARKKGLGL